MPKGDLLLLAFSASKIWSERQPDPRLGPDQLVSRAAQRPVNARAKTRRAFIPAESVGTEAGACPVTVRVTLPERPFARSVAVIV
jgi:hypothetical protein